MNFKEGDAILFLDVTKIANYIEYKLENNVIYYIKKVDSKGFYLYNYNAYITKNEYPFVERTLKMDEKMTPQEIHTLINTIESHHIDWAIDSSLENNDRERFNKIMDIVKFYKL